MSDKSFLRWLDGEQGYSLNTDLRDNKVKAVKEKAKIIQSIKDYYFR